MNYVYRIFLLLLLPILFIDCKLNALVNWSLSSFKHTLSHSAWLHREKPHWSWFRAVVDAALSWHKNHCESVHNSESAHGSAWAVWLYRMRTGYTGSGVTMRGYAWIVGVAVCAGLYVLIF